LSLAVQAPPVYGGRIFETQYTDPDALAGSWQEDKAFDSAIADFERVDDDCGKNGSPDSKPGRARGDRAE
jgi:hypothetical protein